MKNVVEEASSNRNTSTQNKGCIAYDCCRSYSFSSYSFYRRIFVTFHQYPYVLMKILNNNSNDIVIDVSFTLCACVRLLCICKRYTNASYCYYYI